MSSKHVVKQLAIKLFLSMLVMFELYQVYHYPHKTHLVAGFMGEPTGQLKAVANSALLETLPLTLHAHMLMIYQQPSCQLSTLYHLMGPGLCGSVAIDILKLDSVIAVHQSCRERKITYNYVNVCNCMFSCIIVTDL